MRTNVDADNSASIGINGSNAASAADGNELPVPEEHQTYTCCTAAADLIDVLRGRALRTGVINTGKYKCVLKSCFSGRDENVLAVASYDVSVTRPAKQTVLVSHGSFLSVNAGDSDAQVDGNRVRRFGRSAKTMYF
jgi:hypothetical protein